MLLYVYDLIDLGAFVLIDVLIVAHRICVALHCLVHKASTSVFTPIQSCSSRCSSVFPSHQVVEQQQNMSACVQAWTDDLTVGLIVTENYYFLTVFNLWPCKAIWHICWDFSRFVFV